MRLPQTKRSLVLEGENVAIELTITKFATPLVDWQFIHFDRLPDGTWRLLMNVRDENGERVEISNIENMRIMRKD